jgi:hypothetical protein
MDDLIDFGNDGDGYRSTVQNWGFLRLEKEVLDDED